MRESSPDLERYPVQRGVFTKSADRLRSIVQMRWFDDMVCLDTHTGTYAFIDTLV